MPDGYPYRLELPRPTCSSRLSFRELSSLSGLLPAREAVGMAELELLLSGTGPVEVAKQWDRPVDLPPVAASGRCTRCGGATWQHQAHDICGRCGRSVQHEAPEIRLRRSP